MIKYQGGRWCDGFVVLTHMDTIRGKVKLQKDLQPFRTRHFQTLIDFVSEKTCEVSYSPRDIVSFAYAETDYRPFYVYESIKDPKWEGPAPYYFFVERIKKGRCSIFQLQESDATTIVAPQGGGYGSINTTNEKTTYFLKKDTLAPIAVKAIGFKANMREYFSDCPSLIERMDAKKFGHDNWKDMVKFYNDSCK
jgi:hypothetical protein